MACGEIISRLMVHPATLVNISNYDSPQLRISCGSLAVSLLLITLPFCHPFAQAPQVWMMAESRQSGRRNVARLCGRNALKWFTEETSCLAFATVFFSQSVSFIIDGKLKESHSVGISLFEISFLTCNISFVNPICN